MSDVINPPDYYFTGINFNPAFYALDMVGLSEATANNLYLRKTISDTATAIETFNQGIKAQKVDGLLTSSTMSVGNNITSGSLILGNSGIRTKNQGIFETLSIRTPTTSGGLSICTDLTSGSVDIGSANGTINLSASSSGGVNVPTSTGTTTNAVNVAYLNTALTNVARLNQVQTFTELNTFNKPITVGYAASLITSPSMIGYSVKDTITATSCTTAILQDLFTPIILPAGVWLITYSVRWNPPLVTITTADVFIFPKIDGVAAPAPPLQISGTSATQTITTSGLCLTGTFVVSSSGTTNYTISFVINFSGGTLAIQSDTSAYGSSVRRTRIA